MTILAPKIPSSVTIFAEIDATRDDTFLRGLRGTPQRTKACGTTGGSTPFAREWHDHSYARYTFQSQIFV